MDLAAQEAALKALLDGYRATTYTNYIGTGGFALVAFDFLHTLPEEIHLIWPTSLSVPKVLFFVLRYYVIVNNVFAVLYNVPRGLTPDECRKVFYRSAYSTPVLVLGAEAILFIRVYAFSGRSRRMLVYLIVQYLAIHATTFTLLVKFVQSAKFVEMPFANMSCMPVQAESNLLGGVFTTLLCGVVIVMVLMIILALRKHRSSFRIGESSGLLTVFWRDGIFYFIVLSGLLSANIFVTFAAPEGYKLLFTQFTVDMHTVLSTRMLLHLREWAERDRYGSAITPSSLTDVRTRTAMFPSSENSYLPTKGGRGQQETIGGTSRKRTHGRLRTLMEDGLEWSTMQVRDTVVSPVELEDRRFEVPGGDTSIESATQEKGGGWNTRTIPKAQGSAERTTVEGRSHVMEVKRTEPPVQ
ncbi:hypothetical protein FA13DRAFT_1731938 [Coprinellus micaceus]|uniref:DUF6533 domain-containing protein n=1 Tax=Coprinellus micaceus TaxID=71717 RepID=A0A4Y7TF44_COPMI|nr:hypothetical protein FA13DRAFT_1731938 [Coprinellus micaceus]